MKETRFLPPSPFRAPFDPASSLVPFSKKRGERMRTVRGAFPLLGALAVLSAVPGDAFGQVGGRISGGISIGVNDSRFADPALLDWSGSPGGQSVESNPGRRIGIRLSGFVDVALGPRLALRVEASYSRVGMEYRDLHLSGWTHPWPEYEIRLGYLEIPALAKLAVLGRGEADGGSALSLFAGPALAFKRGEEHWTMLYLPARDITRSSVRLDDELSALDPRFLVGAEGRIEFRGRVFTIDLRLARGVRKMWRNSWGRVRAPRAKNQVISLSAGTVLF